MSGVQTGTRLDQLQTLRQRVAHELTYALQRGRPADRLALLAVHIDAEIRAAGGTQTTTPVTWRTDGRQRPLLAVDLLLIALQTTTPVVRAWAVGQGLLPAGRRGRLPLVVVEAYAVQQRLSSIIRKAGTP